MGTCKKLGCHRRIFWLCDSFLLYGSSARNLLGLCSDSLQVLCVFFTPSQKYLLEEKPICWSKEAKDPVWPLLSKGCREKAGFQRKNEKILVFQYSWANSHVLIIITSIYPFYLSLLICWVLPCVYVSVGLFRNNLIWHHTCDPYTPWEHFLYVPNTLWAAVG